MNTPIFKSVWEKTVFRTFADEYTDRLTPEVMRQQGFMAGVQAERQRVLKIIRRSVPKPSKALEAALNQIENTEDE